jgi:hypothetical protein
LFILAVATAVAAPMVWIAERVKSGYVFAVCFGLYLATACTLMVYVLMKFFVTDGPL